MVASLLFGLIAPSLTELRVISITSTLHSPSAFSQWFVQINPAPESNSRSIPNPVFVM
jgi:hypothetical protein